MATMKSGAGVGGLHRRTSRWREGRLDRIQGGMMPPTPSGSGRNQRPSRFRYTGFRSARSYSALEKNGYAVSSPRLRCWRSQNRPNHPGATNDKRMNGSERPAPPADSSRPLSSCSGLSGAKRIYRSACAVGCGRKVFAVGIAGPRLRILDLRKKTRQTLKPDLELASERYRALVEWLKSVRQ
jgi:hypothetical protein